jgi:putative tryptophan/tyrosine transport system substrate-binding protein
MSSRREFITLLGGAAAAWSLAARAQDTERVRRIGVLMLYAEGDPVGKGRATTFRQGLEKLGWVLGRNIEIDFHWGVGGADWIRSAAAQLLKLEPDIIVANGGQTLQPVQQATRAVSIIFIGGSDPVAEGFVQSLAHPGGNVTGFTTLEPTVGAKLLGLLKEIAPRVSRAGVLFNPDNPGSLRLAASAAAAAQQFGVEVLIVPSRGAQEIEGTIRRQAEKSDVGLIVPPDPSINTHRKLIVELTARYQLPTIYALRVATSEGGLMSYGVDIPDLIRQAAIYADRILRGEKAVICQCSCLQNTNWLST